MSCPNKEERPASRRPARRQNKEIWSGPPQTAGPTKKDGKGSGDGFGAEDAPKARAGEPDADEFFAVRLRIMNVDDAALRREVQIVSGARRAVIIPEIGRAHV